MENFRAHSAVNNLVHTIPVNATFDRIFDVDVKFLLRDLTADDAVILSEFYQILKVKNEFLVEVDRYAITGSNSAIFILCTPPQWGSAVSKTFF